MARQYSPKSFLRQAPNRLLKLYLEERGIGADIKWDDLREADIEPVFQAIETAPGKTQTEIDTDFREIEVLADDGGRLLFNFISSRYERGSLIVTSNLEFAKWTGSRITHP